MPGNQNVIESTSPDAGGNPASGRFRTGLAKKRLRSFLGNRRGTPKVGGLEIHVFRRAGALFTAEQAVEHAKLFQQCFFGS